MRLAAAAVVVALPLFAACGDGDEGESSTTTPAPPTARTAVQMIPNLEPLGFKPSAEQLPGFNSTNESTVALFENPAGPVTSLRFEITIAQTEQAAGNRFTAFAKALENPPPGLFGDSNAKQIAGTPAFTADNSVSFRSDKPDSKGTHVFTDLHRFGKATVVFYTIGPNTDATVNVRKAVAEQMAARTPR